MLNLGHDHVKKCKISCLVGLLNEKQASTFVHFLCFSNPINPLNQLCIGGDGDDDGNDECNDDGDGDGDGDDDGDGDGGRSVAWLAGAPDNTGMSESQPTLAMMSTTRRRRRLMMSTMSKRLKLMSTMAVRMM